MDYDAIFMRHKLCPIFFAADGSHYYPECRCGECFGGCVEAHEELGGLCWCHMDRCRFRAETGALMPGQKAPPQEFLDAAREAWRLTMARTQDKGEMA